VLLLNNEHIAQTLKRLRIRRHLTQKQLAEEINVTHQAVSRWEKGLSIPDVQMLMIIADFYDVQVDTILGKSSVYFDSKPQIDRQNEILLNFVRRVVYPILILFSTFGAVMFLFFDKHYHSQIALTALFTSIPLIIMYKVKVKDKKTLFLTVPLISLLVAAVTYGSSFYFYNTEELTLFEEGEQYPSKLNILDGYQESFSYNDHHYMFIYEVFESNYFLYSLDSKLSEMEQEFYFEDEVITSIFLYDYEPYIATLDYEMDGREILSTTTNLYKFNSETSSPDLIISKQGSYGITGGGNFMFYPLGFESSENMIYIIVDGVLEELISLDYPLYRLVDAHGGYYGVISEGEYFKVVKFGNDFEISIVFEETSTFQEVLSFEVNSIDLIAESDETAYLIKGDKVINQVDKKYHCYTHNTIGLYFSSCGSLYDENLNKVKESTYMDENYHVYNPSYLVIDSDWNYIAIDSAYITRLQFTPRNDTIFIRTPYRQIYFFTSAAIIPLVVIGGLSKREDE